jgi:L-alanine-DL-glutamate epimerase-like enolase superfamily enzyme
VRISFRRFDLKLAHRWAIARSVRPSGSGGTEFCQVVFAELTDEHGNTGLGEAAPSSRYEESADSTLAFLEQVEPRRLSFSDVPGSMNYLDGLAELRRPP